MPSVPATQSYFAATTNLCQLGFGKIQDAFYGKSGEKALSVIERIQSFVTGIFLSLPFINLLVSRGALSDGRLITLQQTQTPFPIEIPPLPNYPKYKIDPRHMAKATEQNEDIPEPDGPPVALEDLLFMFDTFTSKLDLDEIPKDDNGNPICEDLDDIIPEVRDRLEFIVDNIGNKTLSGIPVDETEKQYYYQRLEKLLKHITVFLKNPEVPITSILPLVGISTHQAGRYLAAAEECYNELKKNLYHYASKEFIHNDYTDMRVEILGKLIKKKEGAHWKYSHASTHIYNQYACTLGKVIGIPSGRLDYKYDGSKNLNREELLRDYIGLYSESIEQKITSSYWESEHFRHWVDLHIPEDFVREQANQLRTARKKNCKTQRQNDQQSLGQALNTINSWSEDRSKFATELIKIELHLLNDTELETLIKKYECYMEQGSASRWSLMTLARELRHEKGANHTIFESYKMSPDEIKDFQKHTNNYIYAQQNLDRPPEPFLSKKDLQRAIHEQYLTDAQSSYKPMLDYLTDLGILQKC